MYRFTIEDETFDEARESLSSILEDTVTKMMAKNSSEGTVTLKLGISLESTQIIDPETGSIRDMVVPSFSYNVSNVIQTKNSIGGQIAMERELVWDKETGSWAMRDFGMEQMEM